MVNKFHGKIGYGLTYEKPDSPGVWVDDVIERTYSGDILQNYKKTSSGESIIDNIDVNNKISILSDPFALQHFHTIKYVKWMGAAWKVTTVDVRYPRLILTIGGVYNGETLKTS